MNNIISFDIKVNDKVVATFSMNAGETTVNIAESSIVENTSKNLTESVQNNMEIEPIDWHKAKEFVEENDITLTEVEAGVLDAYIKWGKASPKQAGVLGLVLKKLKDQGFKPSYLF